MNLTSPSQVKAWCIENGFHPNRVLGQNFLIDRNALEAIVDAGLAGVAKDGGAAKLLLFQPNDEIFAALSAAASETNGGGEA